MEKDINYKQKYCNHNTYINYVLLTQNSYMYVARLLYRIINTLKKENTPHSHRHWVSLHS
jgi:hypothetical protein